MFSINQVLTNKGSCSVFLQKFNAEGDSWCEAISEPEISEISNAYGLILDLIDPNDVPKGVGNLGGIPLERSETTNVVSGIRLSMTRSKIV